MAGRVTCWIGDVVLDRHAARWAPRRQLQPRRRCGSDPLAAAQVTLVHWLRSHRRYARASTVVHGSGALPRVVSTAAVPVATAANGAYVVVAGIDHVTIAAVVVVATAAAVAVTATVAVEVAALTDAVAVTATAAVHVAATVADNATAAAVSDASVIAAEAVAAVDAAAATDIAAVAAAVGVTVAAEAATTITVALDRQRCGRYRVT